MTGDNNVNYLHSKGVITRQNKGNSMNELKTRFIQWNNKILVNLVPEEDIKQNFQHWKCMYGEQRKMISKQIRL